jgi:hypothetical protein
MADFWDVASCNVIEVSRRFRGEPEISRGGDYAFK